MIFVQIRFMMNMGNYNSSNLTFSLCEAVGCNRKERLALSQVAVCFLYCGQVFVVSSATFFF